MTLPRSNQPARKAAVALGRGHRVWNALTAAASDNPVVANFSSYWDKQAATFDDEPDHGLRDMTVRSAWADLLAAHLPPAPASVADVGCGTGTLAVLMSAVGYGVCGCDSSAGMIEQATAKALTAGVDAEFSVG